MSVVLTTYNHAPYIAEAIEGVLTQQTTFPFEVIIGDDDSTDGTRAIVRDYAGRHPNRIRTVLPDRNLGDQGKHLFVASLAQCRGEFIAFLDGDDYWTSPGKLQTQVDFLAANSDCAMCFHNVLLRHEGTGANPVPYVTHPPPVKSDLDDLLRERCPIASCSPMFPVAALRPLPTWYFAVAYGDWPLYVSAALQGKIGYIDSVMGVYRVHHRGMWSGADPYARRLAIAESYRTILPELPRGKRGAFERAIGLQYYRVADRYGHAGDFVQARLYAWSAIKHRAAGVQVSWRRLVQLIAKPYIRALRGRPPS